MTTDERLRIPDAYRANCELGGELIDTRRPGVHQWTAGWVKQRDGGGGHGISCRKLEERWACDEHVRLAAAGLLNQGALF